jgi:hypothetical protein
MAVEPSFRELCAKLSGLCEALAGLRMTVVEDRPLAGGSLLAESLGDVAEELLAEAREALDCAQAALRAAGPPLDAERARTALAACQESFLPVLTRYFSELVRYESLAELHRLGRERGNEWRAWAGTVHQGAEACRLPVHDACAALFAGWRESGDAPWQLARFHNG